VRVVCFDLGGVLVRIHDGWRSACADTGIAYDALLDSEDFRAHVREALLAQQLGTCTAHETAAVMSAASGNHYSVEQFVTLHASWLQGLYADVEPLVESLRALDGVVTACLSNTDPAHWARLTDWRADAPYRPLGALHHAFASCELGLAKPDAAIFEAVTRVLDVDPAQVLFFDDTPHNVDAARAHGWAAEPIDPTRETVPQLRAHLLAHGVCPPD